MDSCTSRQLKLCFCLRLVNTKVGMERSRSTKLCAGTVFRARKVSVYDIFVLFRG